MDYYLCTSLLTEIKIFSVVRIATHHPKLLDSDYGGMRDPM